MKNIETKNEFAEQIRKELKALNINASVRKGTGTMKHFLGIYAPYKNGIFTTFTEDEIKAIFHQILVGYDALDIFRQPFTIKDLMVTSRCQLFASFQTYSNLR